MNKVTLNALLCTLVLSGHVLAAEIGGYITVKGDLDSKTQLTVAYARWSPRGSQSSVRGRCDYGQANIRSEADLRGSKVAMVWQEGKSCVYRCINLKPGLHKICAVVGRTIAWKTINVPKADFAATVNLVVDLRNTGTLEVMLPSTAAHYVSVWPAWNTNLFNWKTEKYCVDAVGTSADSQPGDKKIALSGLAEGKYKVLLYESGATPLNAGQLSGPDGPYKVHRNAKLVKMWILEIKAGRIVSVRAA